MPDKAKKLWESVYQSSKKDGDKTEVAARKAWAAVKQGWKKVNGKWVKKSDLIHEFSMYITKSSINNGTMTWAAVNSDTDYDSYGERMSLELYKSFISNIKNGDVPVKFKAHVCSDFWCGGMPYLSISHYPDLDGQAVPGEPLEVYVDGNKLKAKGILFDNPLGHAVWRSLKEDKDKNPEEKIRISIGFLDMAHKHGENGKLFVREGEHSLCPECLQGIGDKIYVMGYLVHLALTRVPVNKRTEMVLEEKSEMAKKKTRKDDAASIVGETLAEEIEMKNKVTAQKSDVLIEMSEVETEEETQELIAEAEEPSSETEAEAVAEEPAPIVEEAEVEKSDETFEDDTMAKVAQQPAKYDEDYPLNGATSMRAAEEYIAAQKEMSFVLQAWEVFSTVAWNIIQREDVANKKEMFMGAVDEFRNLLSVKSMAVFSEATQQAEATETNQHELQPAIDALLSAVDNSIQKSEAERAEELNPMLQNLGYAITDFLSKKSVVEQPVPKNDEKNILDEIKNLIQPLSDTVAMLKADLETVKSQGMAGTVEVKSRIPQPRTAVVPPQLQQKAEVVNKSATPKLRDIIEKSVGA